MYSKVETIKKHGVEFIAMWQHREGYPERITVCVDTRERPFLCVLRTGALMFQVFRLVNCEWVAEDQMMGDWESITIDELAEWFDPIPYDKIYSMGDFGLMKIPAEALLQQAKRELGDWKTLAEGYKALNEIVTKENEQLKEQSTRTEEAEARIRAKAIKKADEGYAGMKEENKRLRKKIDRLVKEKAELLTRLNRL